MGIYSNGTIYGIRIYKFENDIGKTMFEHKSVVTMTQAEMREAYLFYTTLEYKTDIHFEYYTECSSTLNPHNSEECMLWYPISHDTFMETFGKM